MELTEYMFLPDPGVWCGYLRGFPDYGEYGKSFEELLVKLHQLHRDLNRSTSSSVCSDATLLATCLSEYFA
jgi:hypothetical protein